MNLLQRYQQFVNDKEARVQDRLDHAFTGLTSEVGELADIRKKWMTKGAPIDPLKVFDEASDIQYYNVLAVSYCGFTFEDLLEWNMRKLERRAERGKDKDAERALLEEFCRERGVL